MKRSGYHAWIKAGASERERTDARLRGKIRAAHPRGTGGSRRPPRLQTHCGAGLVGGARLRVEGSGRRSKHYQELTSFQSRTRQPQPSLRTNTPSGSEKWTRSPGAGAAGGCGEVVCDWAAGGGWRLRVDCSLMVDCWLMVDCSLMVDAWLMVDGNEKRKAGKRESGKAGKRESGRREFLSFLV